MDAATLRAATAAERNWFLANRNACEAERDMFGTVLVPVRSERFTIKKLSVKEIQRSQVVMAFPKVVPAFIKSCNVRNTYVTT